MRPSLAREAPTLGRALRPWRAYGAAIALSRSGGFRSTRREANVSGPLLRTTTMKTSRRRPRAAQRLDAVPRSMRPGKEQAAITQHLRRRVALEIREFRRRRERNLAISLEKECLTSPGEIPIPFVIHVEEMRGDLIARVAMRGYGATRGRVDPTRREHDVPRTTQTPHEIPIGVPVASRTSSCQILPTCRSC
jgi:hypothetical protein